MADGEEGENQAIQFKLINDQGVDVAHWRSFNAKGTAAYTNGDKYDGEFAKGRRHGQGIMTYKNGDIYEGCWDSNAKCGIGKATFINKGHYYGYFQNGKRCGDGLFMFPNKDRYSGAWKNSLKHGFGTYIIDEVNIKMVGDWFEGRLLRGKWIMANGSVYVGEFLQNKPSGNGVWTLSNGNKVEGEYTQETLEKTTKADPENPVDPLTGMRLSLMWRTVAQNGVSTTISTPSVQTTLTPTEMITVMDRAQMLAVLLVFTAWRWTFTRLTVLKTWPLLGTLGSTTMAVVIKADVVLVLALVVNST